MSGSFWKFGQDYSTESPITKILNRAFIKMQDSNDDKGLQSADDKCKYDSNEALESDEKEVDNGIHQEQQPEEEEEEEEADRGADDVAEEDVLEDEDQNSEHEKSEDNKNDSEHNENTLPTSEAEYMNYRPNLDVLDDLLDDEELYTELMCSNFKLLIFLKYPEVLSKLITYVTNDSILQENEEGPVLAEDIDDDAVILEDVDPPDYKGRQEEEEHKDEEEQPEDDISELSEETSITLPPESEEQVESRRACMAAEILSADVWPISSAIMDNEELLSRLWSIMDHASPLSIVASTYFMKINERLLDMDISGMMEFILKQKNVVNRFLNHIDNPPLMDFLLKVISTDKPDTPTGIIEVLKDQDLIPKLLDHLNPDYDTATQSAAGDFLKAFVTISANSNNELASGIGPNELTRQLVSPEMMEKLIKIMLKGSTSLSNGVGIIIELIRKNNSDYDFVQVMYTTLETHPPNDRDPIYLGHLVKLFAKYMPVFNELLVDTKLSPLETPFGSIEPLGFERFKICELVAELLHCSNMTLINESTGENIVRERDAARENIKTLEKQQREAQSHEDKFSMNGSEKSDQQDHEQITDEEQHVSGKMSSLQLSTNEDDASLTTGDDESDEVKSTENNDTEIHSEESSDSEATEKSLRDNPIVGDQLKIALHDTQIIATILNMFFRFAWNNFLHNVVFDIVQQIFNGPLKTGYNRFLLTDLLIQANITKMIMEGDKKCADYEKETGLRLGYMGHLTLIAEEVAKFSAYVEEMKVTFSNPAIWESLNESSWKEYTETVLAETREKYNTVLGDFADEEEDEANPDDMINEHDVDEEDDTTENYDNQEGNLNGPNSYRNFLESTHGDGDGDADADESNTDYNDRYYEYVNGDGSKTRLHLDPSLDYDLPQSKINGEVVENEEATGEDNRFSNYMSHQLSRSFAGNVYYGNDEFDVEHELKQDDDAPTEPENEDAWTSGSGAFPLNGTARRSLPSNPEMYDKNVFQHQFELEGVGEDDDYMDPNDDGQSYAKPNHPLYSNIITPTASHRPNDALYDKVVVHGTEDDVSDDSDAELEEEMEANEEHKVSDEDNEGGYSLCRSTSKDNLSWDENEQDRLMEMVNYNRQQNSTK